MTNEVPTDRVLSTLNRDGTRRWIRPSSRKDGSCAAAASSVTG